jgi:hypothetical protein
LDKWLANVFLEGGGVIQVKAICWLGTLPVSIYLKGVETIRYFPRNFKELDENCRNPELVDSA